MKLKYIALATIMALTVTACNETETTTTSTDPDTKKISYIIGFNMGEQFTNQDIDISSTDLVEGITDAFNQKDARFTSEERMQAMRDFQQKIITERTTKQKELSVTNQTKGEEFLATNKTKEGVVTTDTGLQYTVITPGEGTFPTDKDTVTVNYTGTLIDGTVFDSSVERGEPATFGVTRVIAGWTEALKMMKPGSKWKIFIPSELAYGERGTMGTIGPNETLIFEIELISVEKPLADNGTTTE